MSGVCSEDMKEKFETLYNSYRQKAYTIAYGILRDAHLAEDAVMDSFFVLAEDMDKISGRTLEEARNYLYVIVRNRAFKIYNSRKNIDYVEEIDETIPDIEDIEIKTETREAQQKLFGFIKKLNFVYADILIMRYFYGLSYAGIAKTLGLSVNSVNQRMIRAKKQLKKMIKEAEENER